MTKKKRIKKGPYPHPCFGDPKKRVAEHMSSPTLQRAAHIVLEVRAPASPMRRHAVHTHEENKQHAQNKKRKTADQHHKNLFTAATQLQRR